MAFLLGNDLTAEYLTETLFSTFITRASCISMEALKPLLLAPMLPFEF